MTDFRAYFLPYCLEQVSEGKYVVLNRRYKPLGITSSEHVDYELWAVSIEGLTAKVAAQLSCEGKSELAKIWLFKDDCIPTASPKDWDAYQARLSILAKLQVKK